MDAERDTLNQDRIVNAAIEIADAGGIGALTIRRLAAVLDTKPMTIYYHLPSKHHILDGMVDVIYSEIYAPTIENDWRSEVRRRSVSARKVLADHPWATALMESSETPGPANLRHHDEMVACLHHGGFPMGMVVEVYTLIDSFVFGFALQESNLPFASDTDLSDLARETIEPPRELYPHLAELNSHLMRRPGFSFRDTFELGLDILLAGLESAKERDPPS